MPNNKEVKIHEEWKSLLKDYFLTEKWINLTKFIKNEYKTKKIFPEPKNIFNALNKAPISKVKVVILGQDPYHDIGQAQGLSFSVPKGIKVPPSLKNIYKEIEDDLNIKKDMNFGDLTDWAEQGVLLLNSILTVEAYSPASHKDKGWEDFTDEIIKLISNNKESVVFILWGNYAKSKKNLINHKKHLILESAHPSPFSAYNGFFGSKHFSKCNDYLKKKNIKEIDW